MNRRGFQEFLSPAFGRIDEAIDLDSERGLGRQADPLDKCANCSISFVLSWMHAMAWFPWCRCRWVIVDTSWIYICKPVAAHTRETFWILVFIGIFDSDYVYVYRQLSFLLNSPFVLTYFTALEFVEVSGAATNLEGVETYREIYRVSCSLSSCITDESLAMFWGWDSELVRSLRDAPRHTKSVLCCVWFMAASLLKKSCFGPCKCLLPASLPSLLHHVFGRSPFLPSLKTPIHPIDTYRLRFFYISCIRQQELSFVLCRHSARPRSSLETPQHRSRNPQLPPTFAHPLSTYEPPRAFLGTYNWLPR